MYSFLQFLLFPGTPQKDDNVHPVYQVVYLSKKINIKCESSGPTVWYKDGEKLSSSFIKKKDIYIKKALEVHHGVYTCEGTTPDGEQFRQDAILLVARRSY